MALGHKTHSHWSSRQFDKCKVVLGDGNKNILQKASLRDSLKGANLSRFSQGQLSGCHNAH
jgi:hypothetical protein